jgi:hypothetical protein
MNLERRKHLDLEIAELPEVVDRHPEDAYLRLVWRDAKGEHQKKWRFQ